MSQASSANSSKPCGPPEPRGWGEITSFPQTAAVATKRPRDASVSSERLRPLKWKDPCGPGTSRRGGSWEQTQDPRDRKNVPQSWKTAAGPAATSVPSPAMPFASICRNVLPGERESSSEVEVEAVTETRFAETCTAASVVPTPAPQSGIQKAPSRRPPLPQPGGCQAGCAQGFVTRVLWNLDAPPTPDSQILPFGLHPLEATPGLEPSAASSRTTEGAIKEAGPRPETKRWTVFDSPRLLPPPSAALSFKSGGGVWRAKPCLWKCLFLLPFPPPLPTCLG